VSRKRILTIAIPAAVVFVVLAAINSMRVDSSFATCAYVKFHYGDTKIDAKITNLDDIKALWEILHGFSYYEPGVPGCGYGDDVSITMTNGRRSITFCPACDACDGFRIGNSKWYIDVGSKQRRRFEAIVKKYGMTFPCI